MEGSICDYSIISVKTRDARVADKLVVKDFGRGTKGFADVSDPGCAVCLKPGTELGFSKPVEGWFAAFFPSLKRTQYDTAIFRQVNKDKPSQHHDQLEFPDGERHFLTSLTEGQQATVLQLPAEPKTEAEAAEQKRAEYVG